MFHRVLDRYLNDDGQIEFLWNWGPSYEATCQSRNKLEEATFRYFARIHSPMPGRREQTSEVSPQDITSNRSQQISASRVISKAHCTKLSHYLYSSHFHSPLRHDQAFRVPSEISSN